MTTLITVAGGSLQGAVDIFVKLYTDARQVEYVWYYSRTLFSSQAKSSDHFGTSVSLNNFKIIVGTPDRFSTTQSDIVRCCCVAKTLHEDAIKCKIGRCCFGREAR